MRVLSVFLFALLTSFNATMAQVLPADVQMEVYLPLLKDKRVGVVCNHTAVISSGKGQSTHLIDTLLSSGIDITAAFGPEHGFRGDLPDGEKADDGRDPKTGIPVYSL